VTEPRRRSLLSILVLILISLGVFGAIAWNAYVALHFEAYRYESSDGGFHDFEMPAKGRTWDMMEEMMSDYRAAHGSDVVFYRTFERDVGWRWWCRGEAFYDESHPRWKLPYRPRTPR
jgi:hypothetical protein